MSFLIQPRAPSSCPHCINPILEARRGQREAHIGLILPSKRLHDPEIPEIPKTQIGRCLNPYPRLQCSSFLVMIGFFFRVTIHCPKRSFELLGRAYIIVMYPVISLGILFCLLSYTHKEPIQILLLIEV